MNKINIFLEKIRTILKKELVVLWLSGILISFSLISLQNKGKLPLGAGDFIFLSLILLLVSLYRPRWIFFLFVMSIPLENVILAGEFIPVQLRPYQLLGGILVFAIVVLHYSKHLKQNILKPTWADWAIFSLLPLSFLALINSKNTAAALKQNLVLLSFFILYFLARNFMRNRKDFRKTAFFFLGSNLVVVLYGFYQAFADKIGANSFEVMFGRPNSTFTEPDWLGIFLCFSSAALLSAIEYLEARFPAWKYSLYFVLFLNITLLILTLSRSAWVGAAVSLFLFLFINLYKKEASGPKLAFENFAKQFAATAIIISASLVSVHFGKLSKFDIFDRARSTATNEQKITIACDGTSNVPEVVENVSELSKYDCQHINLEDVEYHKSQKRVVVEIFRNDPNIMTRGTIYQKSWEIIRKHPLLGVGYGAITEALGADERGTGLNESNILLQIWAGSGILGVLVFAATIGHSLIYSFRRLSPICPLNKIFGCPIVKDNFEKMLHTFTLLGIFSLLIPNFFNAGLFMGVFWLGLAAILSAHRLEQ